MVEKYIILASSNDKTFDIPRQLVEINGEPILKRTIRLLKENGVKNIIVTGNDERYKELGVEVYNSDKNDFDYIKRTGYWLNAFDYELMEEPVCFIWGDVYFSEEAIKTIVETKTDDTLFFCSYNNNSDVYIKHHDEPFAYKIVDTELFKYHNERVKRLYDEGKTVRHPIVWEVYRSINGLDINEHKMTKNYVAINDISCDIDTESDLIKLKKKLGGIEMIKVEAIKDFSLSKFDEIKILERKNPNKDEYGQIYLGDIFECDKEMCEYLMGKNTDGHVVVKIIEIEPIKEEYKEAKVVDTDKVGAKPIQEITEENVDEKIKDIKESSKETVKTEKKKRTIKKKKIKK